MKAASILLSVALLCCLGCSEEQTDKANEMVKSALNTVRGPNEASLKTATQTMLSQVDIAITVYQAKTGRLPNSLEALTVAFSDGSPALLTPASVTDAWAHPLEYKKTGSKYTLRSAGPDGVMNTEDDLTN